jgi:hypothetical protein
MMRKKTAILVTCVALLAMGLVGSPTADARGPKLSLELEVFCGYPYAVAIDPITFEEVKMGDLNVAVIVTDVSDDNGPSSNDVGATDVEVTCTAKVAPESGHGKPDDYLFTTMSDLKLDDGVGTVEVECPLGVGVLPLGAIEWKASVTVSNEGLTRDRSDSCEEVPVMDLIETFAPETTVTTEVFVAGESSVSEESAP